MKLTPIVLDVESFWSQDHTLSKLNPIEYAMHPETEIQSCSITIAGKPTVVIFGEDNLRAAFARLPWHRLYVVGHNMSGFDAMILSWRFGIKPAMWGCTLAMARALYAKETPLSLDAILKFLGAPMQKGSLEATNTKGKRLEEFSSSERAAIKEYNKIDGDGCLWVFRKLVRQISVNELRVIDMTIRMLVEPQMVFDVPLLRQTLADSKEQTRRALLTCADLLDISWEDEASRLEEVRAQLASAPKFSAILTALGVETPLKVSKTAMAKGEHKLIPALAKSDDGMKDLCEHENPLVAAAANARLRVKSTQLESRLETFMLWAKYLNNQAPMPLAYCGADTSGRWSGTFSGNVQNLPAMGRGGNPLAWNLRKAMMAPPGHKIVVADLSGIELRVNHFLWHEPESMALFMADAEADLYRAFAAHRYGITPEEVTKQQRQWAKAAQLSLGFGSGSDSFRINAKQQYGVVMDEQESKQTVYDWRDTYQKIVKGWDACAAAIPCIYTGREEAIDPDGLTWTSKRGVHLPSGRIIAYPALHQEPAQPVPGKKPRRGHEMDWIYGVGRHRARIYGPKLGQNIVQSLARDIIVGHMLEFQRTTGFRVANTVHDEVITVVPEAEAEAALAEMQRIMRTPPDWMPLLVTWSEGGVGDRYSDIK